MPGQRLHPLESRRTSGEIDGAHFRLGNRQQPPPGGNRPGSGTCRPPARRRRTHPEPGGSRNPYGSGLQFFPPLGGRLAEQIGHHALFQTVVCRDDGLPVKPDPALFLKAAENLGKSPSGCLVLEDSQNGTTAAHRAGMPVISVPNRVTEQADFSLATSIIRSLTELL